ncbi:hypothetical protein DFQ03_0204 [Maribacter caenipelagi]|uniref:Uncharacterized protein n=1 Tax=Maribacter caenipelagi TaxID=1447781 RepID=A0A4R7DDS9_9FLAO|nr:hypothetical protein DFQ03_0204 [Maribacter caenipelagi]
MNKFDEKVTFCTGYYHFYNDSFTTIIGPKNNL